ncbi:coniferyl-alcohol dehydrogenase [Roseinatronobacter alkalisoli]|uniref:Coniferyl-alcohol dehydrogenase n=1 Tax=Roseinatronobacter alkalisoli TaxID=3028235 RepID=A0ABT5T7N0_9RHOB|nr:coniferyl-alcohol dehydrogenase [Roseinatronobacter sp. HJB301]MDD7970954.1 coniferyl-alcohol dehydrogenase [Roseinatronobacter sp. HJB301]
MTLNGKTIVITGASSGIGAETARLARFQGAHVIGMDRNDPMITLDEFVKVDMGDPAAIDTAVAALPDRIDALVNAAGVSGVAEKDLVARVNYLGLRHLTEALVPRMTGGAVVNVTSILGYEWPQRLDAHKALAETAGFKAGHDWLAANPVAQETCYQYFKEALVVWTKKRGYSLFMDHDIRMNAVAPGPVFTPILGEFVQMLGEERVAADAANIKRPAIADEVAPPILFLCSDAARWVSGINLPVDGGIDAFYT